jgi:hypothetical protein
MELSTIPFFNKSFSYTNTQHSQLRATFLVIERELFRLLGTAENDSAPSLPSELAASWMLLKEQLELGPEPNLSQCRACKHISRSAAIRCSHCSIPFETLNEENIAH